MACSRKMWAAAGAALAAAAVVVLVLVPLPKRSTWTDHRRGAKAAESRRGPSAESLRSLRPCGSVQDTALSDSFDAFFAAAAASISRGPGPRELLEAARRGGRRDPAGYRVALEAAIERSPARAREAASMLAYDMTEADGPLRFATALALAPRLDARAEALLLDALGRAAAAVRPDLVFALRGAEGPEVDRALARLYCEDADPAVRAAAGFALGGRPGGALGTEEEARVREAALRDLAAADEALVKAGADVLGAGPQDAALRARLVAAFHDGTAPEASRMAALRALAQAGADPRALLPDFGAR